MDTKQIEFGDNSHQTLFFFLLIWFLTFKIKFFRTKNQRILLG